jgi:hypothetical protein
MRLARLASVALLLALSLALPRAASATLISEDSTFGTDTVTFDTDTGLRWLDLTESANLTHTQITMELAPGGAFEGYRFATAAELTEFFTNAGIDTDEALDGEFVTQNFDPVVALAGLIGQLADNGNCGTGCSFFFTAGFHAGPAAIPNSLPNGSIAWFDNTAGQDPTSPQAPLGRFIVEGGATDFADPGQGGWLVQVPEPSAIVLLIAGIMGARLFARRIG